MFGTVEYPFDGKACGRIKGHRAARLVHQRHEAASDADLQIVV